MIESDFALTAAIGRADAASSAWSRLMSDYGFDGIAESTQRILPAIFLNTSHDPALPERHRLKGVYRHVWIHNEQLARGLAPVLAALEHEGIAYRLTKGAALIAVTGQPGSRSMADFDIVIHDADAHRVAEIIAGLGFRDSDIPPCPHRGEATGTLGLNFHHGAHKVDVHLASMRYPATLFQAMLTEPPLRRPLGGITVSISQPELLVLHAVIHGIANFSPTDRLQAEVDVYRLSRLADWATVSATARRLGLSSQVTKFLDESRLPTTTTARTGVLTRFRESSWHWRARIRQALPQQRSRIRQIRERSLPVGNCRRDTLGSVRHPVVYRTWQRLGRFGRLEGGAIRVLGGFLDDPVVAMPGTLSAQPFLEPCEAIQTVARPDTLFDWRFRVRLPHECSDVVLRVDEPSLDHIDLYVFANGRFITRMLAGDATQRTVYLRSAPRSLEVSLRPMGYLCTPCFRTLSDMKVDLQVARVID